jgi:hypothetical protein
MAMADSGELIILAPGLKESARQGDRQADMKYGYRGTPATLNQPMRIVS